MTRALAIALLVSASALVSSSAGAQDAPREHEGAEAAEEQEEDEDEDEEAEPEAGPPDITRRDVPDYDGRPAAPPSDEEIALWVPRAILAPFHFIFEYVLRRPLGWLLTTAEREHWDVIQLLPLPGSRMTWGIVPVVLIEFGLIPSAGLYAWLRDVVIRGNHLTLYAGTGGSDWIRGSIVDRQQVSPETSVQLSVQGWARPDYLFYGTGPNARADLASRYGRRRIDGEARLEVRPWHASHLRISAGITANELYDTTYLANGQRTLSDAVASGWFEGLNAVPSGWPGYTAYWQRIEGSIDTREREPESTGGVRVQAHVEHALDVHQPLDRRWLLWGGGAGAWVELEHGRTVGIWTVADLATRLGPRDIPFTELPDYGLEMRMIGFQQGWLIGESAFAAALEYRYPIAPAIAGFVTAALGNAFGPLFEGFQLDLLRMSLGMGLRTTGDPDQSFMVTAGVGTETIEAGFSITTFRLLIGTVRGF